MIGLVLSTSVALDTIDAGLEDVLWQLHDQTGMNFSLAPDLPDDATVRLAGHLRLIDALRAICRQRHLDWSIDDDSVLLQGPGPAGENRFRVYEVSDLLLWGMRPPLVERSVLETEIAKVANHRLGEASSLWRLERGQVLVVASSAVHDRVAEALARLRSD